MHDFTTIKRPDLRKLKQQFKHTKDKEFYITASGKLKIQMIIGDKTYSRLRTETVFIDFAKDKEFYITASGGLKIQMIIGDKTYSRLRTETVFIDFAGNN